MSNLQLRVISAIVLIVAILVPTWFGGPAFRVVAAVIAGAMFFEWATMSGIRRSPGYFGVLAGMLGIVLVAMLAGLHAWIAILLLGATVLVAGIAGLAGEHGWSGAVGLAYAGLSGLALAGLRSADNSGLLAILFLFAVVWSTDILAYFVGRAVGGPKLAPSISPGKTWSGAVGGTLGGLAGGLALVAASGQPVRPGVILVALLLSVVGQVGDLFESGAKRRYGVKDSSNLIPGHGGVMDRVDALVAAAFALYLIGWMLAGADNPAHGLFPPV